MLTLEEWTDVYYAIIGGSDMGVQEGIKMLEEGLQEVRKYVLPNLGAEVTRDKPRIIVEIRGGCLQAVYCSTEAHVGLLDWDDTDDEGQERNIRYETEKDGLIEVW